METDIPCPNYGEGSPCSYKGSSLWGKHKDEVCGEEPCILTTIKTKSHERRIRQVVKRGDKFVLDKNAPLQTREERQRELCLECVYGGRGCERGGCSSIPS